MGATKIKPEAMIEDIGDSMKRRTFSSRQQAATGILVTCALIIFSLRVRWASSKLPRGLMGRP